MTLQREAEGTECGEDALADPAADADEAEGLPHPVHMMQTEQSTTTPDWRGQRVSSLESEQDHRLRGLVSPVFGPETEHTPDTDGYYGWTQPSLDAVSLPSYDRTAIPSDLVIGANGDLSPSNGAPTQPNLRSPDSPDAESIIDDLIDDNTAYSVSGPAVPLEPEVITLSGTLPHGPTRNTGSENVHGHIKHFQDQLEDRTGSLSDTIQNSPHRIFPKSMDIAMRYNGGEEAMDSPQRVFSEVGHVQEHGDGAVMKRIPPPPVPRIRKVVAVKAHCAIEDDDFSDFVQHTGDETEDEDFYEPYGSTAWLHRKSSQDSRKEENDSSSCSTMSSASSTALLLKNEVSKLPKLRFERTDDVQKTREELSGGQYVDLVQSGQHGRALLAATLDQVRRSLEELSSPHCPLPHPLHPPADKMHRIRNNYFKNLIVLSVGFMLVFTAFSSLRNLQSSINHDNGLGLMSLSVMYAAYLLGCLLAPMVIQHCRPKKAIVLALIPVILFTLANFYPSYYTLIPASALVGFGNANIWTAQGTYITSIAVSYAAVTGKNHSCILGVFNGFFLFLLQLAQLFGNLITSTVFSMELAEHEEYAVEGSGSNYSIVAPVTPNIGICGARYCHDYSIDHASVNVQLHMVWILLSVFTAFILIGGLLMLSLLDRLDVIFIKQKKNLRQQLLALSSLHTDARLLLYIPFLLFLGIEEAFIFGEFTKAYITCALGLHMFGYVMMVFAGVDAVACFLFGNLQKWLSRLTIVTAGILWYAGVLAYMLLWTPSADLCTVLLIAAGLGIADAAWQSQTSSITGELFPNNREAAFASLRMYEALGFVAACACAQYLCIEIKIYAMCSMLALVFVSYSTMELVHKRTHDTRSPDSV